MIGLAIATGVALVAPLAHSQTSTLKSTAQQPNYNKRIIGGKEAPVNQYPFMTALIQPGVEQILPFCGASFLGGRYVLTASHCIVGNSADNVEVWIGGHDVTQPSGGKRVKVAQIYEHEFYDNGTLDNDVAILELVDEVTGVTPINIITPELEATLKEGFEFTVMGWGNLRTDGQEFPNKLQEVNVPLYNRAQCLKEYTQPDASESDITEQMLCAGFVEGGKDSCQGDSGGPLIFQHENKWYQAGVVSFGNACAAANAPGIYSRLSRFNQWITEKTAGVSYQQNSRLGFVEKTYEEEAVFNIKNVAQAAYTVTNASISATDNLESAEIAANTCTGKILAFNDSCDIKVNVKTNMLGKGTFTLQIDTNNPENKQASMFFSADSIEQETLDMPSLTGVDKDHVKWWGGGDANWQVTTTKSSQGDNAVSSGDISHFQSSVLLATIDSDRVEQFDFKYLVSSEDGYDVLQVLHNNSIVANASGTNQTEFASTTLKLAEGTDRITFIYRKDSTDEDVIGDDKAYVDEVSVKIKNTAPVVKLAQTSISVEEGKSFTLDASGSSDAENDQLTYNWQVISADKVPLTNAANASQTLTAPAYKDAKSLRFKVTVTDAFGSASSADVNVTITEKPKSGGSFGFALLSLVLLATRRKWH